MVFALALIILPLLPIIHLVPSNIVMAERYLFLPTFGYSLLLSLIIFKILEWIKKNGCNKNYLRILLTIIIIIAGVYAITTFRRNQNWKDEETLWIKTYTQIPDDARANHNFGAILAKQNKYEEAILKFQKAIELKPDYAEAYNSLGLSYLAKDQPAAAKAAILQALKLQPHYLEAVKNLGDVYLAQENFSQAIIQYKKYLEFNLRDEGVNNNLALAYLNFGQLAEAKKYFGLALELNPNLIEAKIGLALAFAGENNFSQAAALLREVLAVEPGNELAKEKLLLIKQLEK